MLTAAAADSEAPVADAPELPPKVNAAVDAAHACVPPDAPNGTAAAPNRPAVLPPAAGVLEADAALLVPKLKPPVLPSPNSEALAPEVAAGAEALESGAPVGLASVAASAVAAVDEELTTAVLAAVAVGAPNRGTEADEVEGRGTGPPNKGALLASAVRPVSGPVKGAAGSGMAEAPPNSGAAVVLDGGFSEATGCAAEMTVFAAPLGSFGKAGTAAAAPIVAAAAPPSVDGAVALELAMVAVGAVAAKGCELGTAASAAAATDSPPMVEMPAEEGAPKRAAELLDLCSEGAPNDRDGAAAELADVALLPPKSNGAGAAAAGAAIVSGSSNLGTSPAHPTDSMLHP